MAEQSSQKSNQPWDNYKKEDLEKMHVKDLKKILNDHNLKFNDLHEKEELVDLIMSKGLKHDPLGHGYSDLYSPDQQ